jgi:hypothetical protein
MSPIDSRQLKQTRRGENYRENLLFMKLTLTCTKTGNVSLTVTGLWTK